MKKPKKYDTKKLLISIAKKQNGKLSIHSLHDFMRFLYQQLAGNKTTDNYVITYDLNAEGIEKVISKNTELFEMNPRRDTLIINKNHKDYQNLDSDELIDQIIDEYYNF